MKMISFEVKYQEEDDGSGWSVEFPGLEGCVTCGSTLDEARSNAEEALTVYLESVDSRGLLKEYDFPEPGVETVTPDLVVAFALTLRLLRTQSGLTQADVAAILGVEQPTYNRWENPEKCNVTLSTFRDLARAFNRKPELAFVAR